MEAISTSVPSINVRKLHPKPHHFHHHHLKPSLHLNHHPHISTPTTVTNKLRTPLSSKPPPPSHHTHTHTHTPPPSPTHNNAATGYAAALIDAALCSNSLHAIYKDVQRLLKWLKHNEVLKAVMDDPLVEEGVKGRVVKEVAEKAKFRRQVVAMVKMLVAKNKSGLVVHVMEAFEGIYYQLNSSSIKAVG